MPTSLGALQSMGCWLLYEYVTAVRSHFPSLGLFTSSSVCSSSKLESLIFFNSSILAVKESEEFQGSFGRLGKVVFLHEVYG